MLDLPVENGDGLDVAGIDIVFSAVESDAARVLEPQYAKTAAVLSTASAFRYEDDVPILVPGVNLAHAAQIDGQRRRRGWRGFIAPLPNCTTMGLVVTLKPLARSLRGRARGDDLDAGPLGRGPLARRRGARHRRQHHPVHPRRGGEGRPRDGEDPRRPGRGRHRAGRVPRQRDLHPRRRQRRAYRGGGGVARPARRPRRTWPRPSASSAASSRGSPCRRRRSE